MNNPMPAPKVLKVASLVAVCPCGRWLGRWPEYLGVEECFDPVCPNDDCTHTSAIIRQGRAYGPKSKEWASIVEEFNELWPNLSIANFDGLVTDPPLPDIDNGEQVEMWMAYRTDQPTWDNWMLKAQNG